MMIIFFILITFSLDQVLIPCGEIWFLWLLGLKKKVKKHNRKNSLSIYDLESLNSVITKDISFFITLPVVA